MTVVMPQLPPPGGSQQEVMFRRMLLQCSQRVQQAGAQDTAKDWQTDAKFHCIVDALQERLYDLEHAGAAVRPGPDVLQQYQAAVHAIAVQLQQPELPAYCLRVTRQDKLPAAEAAAGVSSSSQPARTREGQQNDRSTAVHEQQQQGQNQQPQRGTAVAPSSAPPPAAAAAAAAGAASGPAGRDDPSFSLSNRTQTLLTTQQRLQDSLTDELLEMGQELKSSTLAMQNAIRYRGKLLDDAEVSLVNSTENAKAVAAKAKEQYKQGNWNLCHTCIIVLSVFVIFSFMLVAIRVSSMVGLKGS